MATTQTRVSAAEAGASSDEIRTGIQGTRRDMDETLDQLGERLHPRHLLDDVIDLFRGGGSGGGSQIAAVSKRAGGTVAAQIKEHPLPALLVGAGLIWWLVDSGDDGRDRRTRFGRAKGMPLNPDAYLERGGDLYRDPLTTSVAADLDRPPVGDPEASGVGERLKEGASAVKDRVGSAVSDAGRRARSAVSSGWEGTRTGLHSVGHRGHAAADRLSEAGDQHPLAVGGICLAAGLLAGLLLPRTEREDEWMGEAADEVRADLRSRGENLVEQGKAVAHRAVEAAQGEAGQQGVAPSDLTDKAARVVNEAVSAAQRTAEEEGLTAENLKKKVGSVAQSAKSAIQEETGRSRSEG